MDPPSHPIVSQIFLVVFWNISQFNFFNNLKIILGFRSSVLRSDRVRAVLAADHRGRGHRDRQRQNLRQNGRKELRLQMIKIFFDFSISKFQF